MQQFAFRCLAALGVLLITAQLWAPPVLHAQLTVAAPNLWPGAWPRPLLRPTRAERQALLARPSALTARRLEQRLHELGYLQATVTADTTASAVRLGPFYRLQALELSGEWSERWRARVPLPQQRRAAVPYSQAAMARLTQPLRTQLGDEGFLQAQLIPTVFDSGIDGALPDSVAADTLLVRAQLALALGPRVRLSQLIPTVADPKQRLRESDRFVAALLRLKPGAVLSARALADIPALLDASPYYRSAGAPSLSVDSGRATVTVPLRIERANRFDAVIGFLPPRQGQADWQFTGLVDLALVSPLGTGESLQLKYEELPSRSRRLDARIIAPFLGGSPLDLDLRLNLLKQDSLFQTVRLEPALRYTFAPQLVARLSYRDLNTSLLSVRAFRTQSAPPPSLDGRSTLVALGLTYTRLDYPFNPRRGLSLSAEVALGTKTVRRTRGLDSLDLSRVIGRQPRREWQIEAWNYLPVGRNQTLLLGARAYWLDQAERFDNDLAFVGGARLLRGFNEQQFLASLYAIATLEYRLLIERDGYLSAFVDVGYLERRTFQLNEFQRPLGYGIGLQIPTAAGVLSLAYAIGQAPGLPPQAARGRIHLGFVSRF